LWTSENACCNLLCTKSWEFLTHVCECRTIHIQSVYKVFLLAQVLSVMGEATLSLFLAEVQMLHF
jgi:hypothetical protein